MKADIMGIPYNQLGDYQFSLIGCAVIVGYSLGIFTDMEKTAESINKNNEKTMFKPNSERVKMYLPYKEIFNNMFSYSLHETLNSLYQAGSNGNSV